MRYLLAGLLFVGSFKTPIARPDTHVATVVQVIAGDRVRIETPRGGEELDLFGVVSPAVSEPRGLEAMQILRALCLGHRVAVTVRESRMRGRRTADIRLSSGLLLNHELLRSGFGWWFWRESPDDLISANLVFGSARGRSELLG